MQLLECNVQSHVLQLCWSMEACIHLQSSFQPEYIVYICCHILLHTCSSITCSFVSLKVRPRPKLLHAYTRLFRHLFVADVSSVLELPCLYVGVLGLGQPLGGILACGRAEVQNWVGLKLDLKYLFKKESHS